MMTLTMVGLALLASLGLVLAGVVLFVASIDLQARRVEAPARQGSGTVTGDRRRSLCLTTMPAVQG